MSKVGLDMVAHAWNPNYWGRQEIGKPQLEASPGKVNET
jgi:hypothetical protein